MHITALSDMRFILSVRIQHINDLNSPYRTDIKQSYRQQTKCKENERPYHRIRKKHPR